MNVNINGKSRDGCGNGNVYILLDCISVNILISILYYKSYQFCKMIPILGNCVKGTRDIYLCIISCNYM